MNLNKILLTSSDNIPNSKVHQHFGIVDSQIVIGANIFRDVFSNFRDIFGGEAKGYKKDLRKMKDAAFREIREKACKHGANAIISLKIDLDEISGGGKSMFMINVYGTAIKLDEAFLTQEQELQSVNEISIEDLEYHKERNKLKKKIGNLDDLSAQLDLDDLTKYDLWNYETSYVLLRSYKSPSIKLQNNFSEIPIEYVEEFLRDEVNKINSDYWDLCFKDLNKRNWYNHKFLLDLLQSENYIKRFRALKLCMIQKDSYQREDVDKLKNIGEFLITEFDETVESREVSKMIGNKTVYTCPYCLSDSRLLDDEEKCECGKNKYGFTLDQNNPESIGKYLIKMSEALESAFNKYES